MADTTTHEAVEAHDDEAFEWRVEQYLAMKYGEKPAFNEAQARALAASITTSWTVKDGKKSEWPLPLNWKKVKDALDSGKCDPDLAIQVFVTEGC